MKFANREIVYLVIQKCGYFECIFDRLIFVKNSAIFVKKVSKFCFTFFKFAKHQTIKFLNFGEIRIQFSNYISEKWTKYLTRFHEIDIFE